jgi:hypothetical protein
MFLKRCLPRLNLLLQFVDIDEAVLLLVLNDLEF